MEMTTSSKPEIKKPKEKSPDSKKISGQIATPIDISSDPDYIQLVEHYQQAEFDKCEELIDKLEKKYPGHPRLLKFKYDLQMKLSFKTIAVTNEKKEKHKKVKATINKSAFAFISTTIVMIVFSISFFYLNNLATARRLLSETAQLTSLYNQAEQLLLAGQPQPAEKIIERMISINPAFEKLPELKSQTDNLLRLETDYQTALDLVTENKKSEALVILKQIETEKPGMWDVSHQITLLETSIQLEKYLEEGNAAYQIEKWDQVITAYENALVLDPNLDDPQMKEQLLNSYLKKIIGLLQSDNTSIDDIKNAELYYRRAVAMIPQNKAFASERGSLQEASSNLLEMKFIQTAKAILEDKNQTTTSIDQAVSYLNEAANINPKNTALQLDQKNAEIYQTAFQKFIEMNWVDSITNLNQIVSFDSNYANGNVKLLLYEAYYALGKQYNSLSLYQEARNNLEQAEILAWDDSNNIMKLFQVQVLLGDTIGKMSDYKDAVSYYQYALKAINISQKLTKFPDLNTKYNEANNLVDLKKFENAFTAFQEVLKGIDVVYSISETKISDGACLAFFANENLSTVDAIIEANNLPKNMIISFGRDLKVPKIEK
jgi:tetratricopeptide (TPR) repeat protein